MELRKLEIRQDRTVCRQAAQLYRRAFPKEERLPWWLLRLQARRRGIDLTAWMEGERFCGFTSSVTVEGLHFVLFLAVHEAMRAKGCGSGILSALKAEHGCVVLNVEPLDPAASNYDQRQRRFRFYEGNGFYDTGWFVWEVGGKFRVLSTHRELDADTYRKVFKKLTLGLWRVKLLKAD